MVSRSMRRSDKAPFVFRSETCFRQHRSIPLRLSRCMGRSLLFRFLREPWRDSTVISTEVERSLKVSEIVTGSPTSLGLTRRANAIWRAHASDVLAIAFCDREL